MKKIEKIIGLTIILVVSAFVGAMLAFWYIVNYQIPKEQVRLNSTGFTTHREVEFSRCLEGLEFEYSCPTDLKVDYNYGQVETYDPQPAGENR